MSLDRRSISVALFGLAGGTVLPSHESGSTGPRQVKSSSQGSARERLGVVNARDFGAVGDASTDDTMALQAFLDTVVTRGLHGYIPTGTYRTTAPLRVGNDDPENRFRGFVIEGAGRTGLNGGRPPTGGTLIFLDAPDTPKAVVLWTGNAWRDARLTSLGLSSSRMDGAEFGLLIESSEVSHLEFDYLHVENVTTAFGLARGTGANGEFCGWSHVQTWRVQNYFWSDAGQAYGLRFRDSFCYYRAGGTLFRFDTGIVGGGLRLINFDASPTLSDAPRAPAERADTTLFALANKHNAPITVIGGRFEHITTLVDINTDSADIVVHNQVQFIGSDFTTDLDEAGAAAGRATVRLQNTALADLQFSGCSFATALHKRTDLLVKVQADRGCRGSVRFVQCGFWGYARPPSAGGPLAGALRVSWSDCTANNPNMSGDWRSQTLGGRFERQLGEIAPPTAASNLLLHSAIVAEQGAVQAEEPWVHSGKVAFHKPAAIVIEGVRLVLAAGAGLHQDVVVLGEIHYRAAVRLATSTGMLRLTLSDVGSGRVLDEVTIVATEGSAAPVKLFLHAQAGGLPGGRVRVALHNLGIDSLTFEIMQQQASEYPSAAFAATLDHPIRLGGGVGCSDWA